MSEYCGNTVGILWECEKSILAMPLSRPASKSVKILENRVKIATELTANWLKMAVNSLILAHSDRIISNIVVVKTHAPLAHAWLEQRTHNPLVRGSTP